MPSIRKLRFRAKKAYRIGKRCKGYDFGCPNCFRYSFLDCYKRFPTKEEWDVYFDLTK